MNLTDDQIDENTAALGQQALRAGLFAQLHEPAFAAKVKHEWERTNLPLHEQALINAVSRAQEQSVFAQLRHPLLHIAAENYSTTPLAGQAILGFFNQQLIRFGVNSENDCPVDDYAIAQWIECGIEFGREMSDSEQVKAIVAELGETRIAEIRYINHGKAELQKGFRTTDAQGREDIRVKLKEAREQFFARQLETRTDLKTKLASSRAVSVTMPT